jgi:hypothetical protein
MQGTYTLPFVFPSTSADYQANGYRWNAGTPIPQGSVNITVGFGPLYSVCASPKCSCECFVRVVAFGSGFFFSGEDGDSVLRGTPVACTLACGNITQTYNITHPGLLNFSPSSIDLAVTIPVNFVALP